MSDLEILNSIQFVVNSEGHPSAVLLSIEAWEALINYLDDLDDRGYLKEILPRLHCGPLQDGALDWGDVKSNDLMEKLEVIQEHEDSEVQEALRQGQEDIKLGRTLTLDELDQELG